MKAYYKYYARMAGFFLVLTILAAFAATKEHGFRVEQHERDKKALKDSCKKWQHCYDSLNVKINAYIDSTAKAHARKGS